MLRFFEKEQDSLLFRGNGELLAKLVDKQLVLRFEH